MEPENREGSGPIIGTIIILLVIVLGGLYFWSTRTRDGQAASPETSTTSDASLEAVGTQSSSDDAASIEADLNATNIDSVDSGLSQ